MTPNDDPARLGLLVSAIASRALQVTPGEPGGPASTDGRAVFVDVYLDDRPGPNRS